MKIPFSKSRSKSIRIKAQVIAGQPIDQDEFQFRRLSGASRKFEPMRWEQSARAGIHLYDNKAMATRIVDIPYEAMTTADIKIETEDPAVRAFWDDFWNDETMGFKKPYWLIYIDGQNTGETILPIGVNEVNGQVEIGFIDPFSIQDDPKLKPGNPLQVESIKITTGEGAKPFKVINPDPFTGLLEGDAFYFQNKKAPNDIRGFPRLHSQADDLEMYTDYVFEESRRAFLMNLFLLHIKRGDETPEQLKAWKKENFPDGEITKRSMVEITNSAVDMEFKVPDFKGADRAAHSKMVRGHLFSGAGMPGFFFGDADNANVATAREMMRPTIWAFTPHKDTVLFQLTMIFKFKLQQAIIHRRMTREGFLPFGADQNFKLKFNSIYPKEWLVQTTAMKDLVFILGEAQNSEWLAPIIARETFVGFMEELGVDIDKERNEQELKKAKEEKAKQPSFIETMFGNQGQEPNGEIEEPERQSLDSMLRQ